MKEYIIKILEKYHQCLKCGNDESDAVFGIDDLDFEEIADKIVSFSERQPNTEANEQHDSKALSIADVSNCAFQYYNGSKVVCDKFEITLEEAKKLWNKYYEDMVEKTTDDLEIEVAIWINMKDSTDYRETLIHLSSPEVRNGKLYEPKYYDKF